MYGKKREMERLGKDDKIYIEEIKDKRWERKCNFKELG